MKLYYSPGVCSLSPHIVLHETATPFELVKTDIKAKTTDGGGDYRKVNPNGYVPALVLDDGSVLTEGPAILQYIADKAGATALAPAAGTIERSKLQQWLNFVSTEMHKGFSPLFNPAMPAEAKDLFKQKLQDRMAFLDKHFAQNDYLMGKTYTVADSYLFTVLRWAKPMGIDLSAYPNIQAYSARVEARPAVQAALKSEGLLREKAA